MPCYKPIKAYKSLTKRSKNGKTYIAFKLDDAGGAYELLDLPCGQCIGCRLDRSKDWAVRCVHEASLYDFNCFITLTFDDEHMNEHESLVKSDFQNFMKRLRKKYNGFNEVTKEDGTKSSPIRFFHCGEYGSLLKRPHHHACLFNFDFPDKVLWSIRKGVRLYRSAELEKLWPFGFSTIGDVTFESAAYVARYVTKKLTGDMAAIHYSRVDEETGEMFYVEPEYITMSRRPGIGKGWMDKFGDSDVYSKDFITINGKIQKVPRYYDKIYDKINPTRFSDIKAKRIEKAKSIPWQEKCSSRLNVKRIVKERKINDCLERTVEQ